MSTSPSDLGYWSAKREQRLAENVGWPDSDPAPLVTNTEPRPDGAPSDPNSVTGLAALGRAGGWDVLTGYSRSLKRAQKIGTYTEVETIGVWAGSHPASGWRWSAEYQRKASGGTWAWVRVHIWRPGHAPHADATVTDLKEFIGVRGSVLPSWFEAITDRVRAQEAKAKAAPKKTKPREAVN